MDGLILKTYIENQKRPKTHIAKALGMSKQNLYQLFDSNNFAEETIKNIENLFKVKWGAIKASVNIDSNIATPENKVSNGHENAHTGQLLETINLLVRQNDKLIASYDKIAEANKILAGKVEPVSVNVEQERTLTVQTILPGLQELLIDLGLGKLWENRSLGETILNKRLYGHQEKKQSRGIRDGSGK